ncbi:hypothetical protein LSTR_LSTR001315 [Laodelphax striatellus]|uniref:Fe2OG dioxygenase domain-containing protein n=1 Tax=Laodelphax striatellus TaxID=195883 RepID=A0A482XFP3_LAOST|nr:hypothetical protein LSTR_LSTR001315 [Laodelphax striatellus]
MPNMEVADSMIKDNEIPVVDLSHMGSVMSPVKPWVKKAAKQLERALSHRGLALIVNHGISEQKLQAVYRAMKKFCELSEVTKSKYEIKPNAENHGYVSPGIEKFAREKSEEVRHAFNVLSFEKKLPDEELPGFRDSVSYVADEMRRVAHIVLQIMAVGLDLDPNLFLNKHQNMLKEGNVTTLRVLHYPPMGDRLIPGQMRCGEHTDYGSFTLLVQDSEGGLEVSVNGKWKRVGHLPGAILINIGDLMDKWTSGKFPAVRHRVVVPEQKTIRLRGRNSIAFFVHPENDTIIDPAETVAAPILANEAEPPPKRELTLITAYQHFQERLRESRIFRLLRTLRKRLYSQRAVPASVAPS